MSNLGAVAKGEKVRAFSISFESKLPIRLGDNYTDKLFSRLEIRTTNGRVKMFGVNSAYFVRCTHFLMLILNKHPFQYSMDRTEIYFCFFSFCFYYLVLRTN